MSMLSSYKNIGIYLIALLLMIPIYSKEKIKILITKPQSSTDSTQAYYTKLIKLALEKSKTTDRYSIQELDQVLSQARTLAELSKKNGRINIFQTGTSIEREKHLIVIRIPLLKGSLGYRISLIHKDNIDKLAKVSTLQDLSKLTACQGAHWPDSTILESAGLTVVRNSNYKNMFLQVKNKHCDYFPRAIIEAYSEAKAYNDPDVVVYDKLVISYPFPMYFFVSPDQKQLAADIENGLRIAIKDGSFDSLFKKNKITKNIYPLDHWKTAKFINIENPILPKEIPINDPKLWIKLQ